MWSWWQFSFRFWTKLNSIWLIKSNGKLSPRSHIPFNGNVNLFLLRQQKRSPRWRNNYRFRAPQNTYSSTLPPTLLLFYNPSSQIGSFWSRIFAIYCSFTTSRRRLAVFGPVSLPFLHLLLLLPFNFIALLGPVPTKDMQTLPPPLSFDPIFMEDTQCAETNEKSISRGGGKFYIS